MTSATSSIGELGWVVASSIFLAFALARSFRALRGTTLVAAIAWAAAAVAALVGAEMVGMFGNVSQASLAAMRYLGAVMTLAPAVAVLGAKRPQHRAWQWIVLTLVVVLALPAGETLLFHPNAALLPHAAQSAFIFVLILIGFGNYAPTRNALPAIFAAIGQASLFAPFIPWLPANEAASHPCVGLTFLTVAVAIALINSTAFRRADGWNGAWLDFRDAYGVVWSLRVAERFNRASITHGSSVQLTWRGIVVHSTGDDSHDDNSSYTTSVEFDRASQRRLRAMLLRFVSNEWIARRIGHT